MNAILPAPYQGAGLAAQKVQYEGALGRGEQGRFEMVETAGQEEVGISNPASKTYSDDASTKGWGAVLNTQTRTGGV